MKLFNVLRIVPSDHPYNPNAIWTETDETSHERYELLVPYEKWPEELKRRHGRHFRYVFRSKFGSKLLEKNRDKVCICVDIAECPQKLRVEDLEIPSCPYFYKGVCIAATAWANESRPLSWEAVAFLSEKSSKQARRDVNKALKMLQRDLEAHPLFREVLREAGTRTGK